MRLKKQDKLILAEKIKDAALGIVQISSEFQGLYEPPR
jgi:hypothetical protein